MDERSAAGRRPADGRPVSRAYLDVPYAEKEAAKALGARWDQSARRWYDPRPSTPGLDRWAARPPVSDLSPGEDRAFGAGLFVDMVPARAGSPTPAPASARRTGNGSDG